MTNKIVYTNINNEFIIGLNFLFNHLFVLTIQKCKCTECVF